MLIAKGALISETGVVYEALEAGVDDSTVMTSEESIIEQALMFFPVDAADVIDEQPDVVFELKCADGELANVAVELAKTVRRHYAGVLERREWEGLKRYTLCFYRVRLSATMKCFVRDNSAHANLCAKYFDCLLATLSKMDK